MSVSYDGQFDIDQFNSLKEIMGSKFDLFVQTYISGSEDYIAEIKKGFAESNAKKVEYAAHPLKSSSRQFSCEDVASIAEKLEIAAVNNQIEGLENEVDDLEKKFEEFKLYLESQIA
ncbi:MAG: hypothetical protein CMP22_06750 [Rickettsiales bacterium]|nr:hypothetical protein [Rickettsiales bacterium]|tara:strand:- start:314 stop:664 length:351 start_codon:yes stop_codon:yes gene_type:complete